ncbi:MAG: hypothetical protein A3G20_09120 [Acidobacteria bacterium RIFCSPLOWO2_12_FULL_59_11]|nr:MAG: hypothetical protein A3G20_09120 [Acidobacteria bacterium RIFCSPLOWO2_12_FULL_59_11]
MKKTAEASCGRFLIIGCGSIGNRHLENLKQLGVGDLLVFDVQDDRRREVKERFGAEVATDISTALCKNPKAAIICSPTHLHLEHALAAARAGCHLFIEKPLADSLDGLDELMAEIKQRRLQALVGCNFRFHPGLRHVKSLLDDGAIGKIISARAHFGYYLPDWHPMEDYRKNYSAQASMGGGVVLDRVHEIDYVRWLLGEVTEVAAMMNHASSLQIDSEDVAEILLRFQCGAIGSLHMDYVRRTYGCTLEITGEEGTIHWSYQGSNVRWYRAETALWQTLQWPPYETNQMYLEMMRHFLRVLAGEEEPLMNLSEGRRVLQIALAARQSSQEGRRLSLRKAAPKKIIGIIQARMGSSRLPGKSMMDLAGKPVVAHAIERLRSCESIHQVVVATTTAPADEVILQLAKSCGVEGFAGSPEDVLDRYYHAAVLHYGDLIVRVTGDCPLIDPTLVDVTVQALIDSGVEYASNCRPVSTYPEGLDVEVFTLAALERAWREARLHSEREHVTPYIWRHPQKFTLYNIKCPDRFPRVRLTVDESIDLQFLRELFQQVPAGSWNWHDLVDWIDRHRASLPDNTTIPRDQGYIDSLICESGIETVQPVPPHE